MEIQTQNKRKADLLTPPINEVQKRYSWTPNIPTHNKYNAIADLEANPNDNLDDEHNQHTTDVGNNNETITTKSKIPPIYLHNAINYIALTSDIKKLTTGEFTTFCSTNTLRINVTKADDYRILTKYFKDNEIKFHTFQNPKDKPLNVVIKNIPLSLSEQEIFEELTRNSLPVIKVTRLQTKNKQPLPVCAVDLNDNENAKKIYSLKHIHQSIKPEDEPKCANCGGPHPASYRGCSHHIEIMQKRTKNDNTNNQRGTESNGSYIVNPKRSYADQVRNSTATNSNPNNANQSPNVTNSPDTSNIAKILIDLLTPYLPLIKNFITNTLLPLLLNGS
ncbi:hypothetical protein RI129_011511 [Pyrocoelia pectoralis]|uniref:Pre-C2HC domain-containing protein n=1 Tax=Pyrocoelia pectoralis TaxID=417401 RepID=A0AAN7V8Y7_9COLE